MFYTVVISCRILVQIFDKIKVLLYFCPICKAETPIHIIDSGVPFVFVISCLQVIFNTLLKIIYQILYVITCFFPKLSGESVKITSDDVMDADDGVDEACIDYVFAPAGLYPLPMPRNTK